MCLRWGPWMIQSESARHFHDHLHLLREFLQDDHLLWDHTEFCISRDGWKTTIKSATDSSLEPILEIRLIVWNRDVVSFSLKKCRDQILYVVISMTVTHLILGRPRLFDRNVNHDARDDTHSFVDMTIWCSLCIQRRPMHTSTHQ